MHTSPLLNISSTSWVNDIRPLLERQETFINGLSATSEQGLSGLFINRPLEIAPYQLYSLLDDHHLSLMGAQYHGTLMGRSALNEWEQMQDHLSLLKTLDCSTFHYVETSQSVQYQHSKPLALRPRISLIDWCHYGQKLDQIAGWMSQLGIELVVCQQLGTAIQTAEDIAELISHTRHTKVAIDTGYLRACGDEPAAVIDIYHERIQQVTIKDVRVPLLEEMNEYKASFHDMVSAGVFAIPGEGNLITAPLIKTMHSSLLSCHWIMASEQYHEKIPPHIYIKKGISYLNKALAQLTKHKQDALV